LACKYMGDIRFLSKVLDWRQWDGKTPVKSHVAVHYNQCLRPRIGSLRLDVQLHGTGTFLCTGTVSLLQDYRLTLNNYQFL
jgi:hypothetical protein